MICEYYGIWMILDYKMCGEVTTEVHEWNALRLKKCFDANAGTFIKFGQMIGSGHLDFIIPEEYIKAFDPTYYEAP